MVTEKKHLTSVHSVMVDRFRAAPCTLSHDRSSSSVADDTVHTSNTSGNVCSIFRQAVCVIPRSMTCNLVTDQSHVFYTPCSYWLVSALTSFSEVERTVRSVTDNTILSASNIFFIGIFCETEHTIQYPIYTLRPQLPCIPFPLEQAVC